MNIISTRKSIIILWAIALYSINLKSQFTPTFVIEYITSQSQVNQFTQKYYPNTSVFPGSLYIMDDNDGVDDIIDLSPLTKIKGIKRDLKICFNKKIKNLKGLENIKYVGRDLIIQGNIILDTLDHLNQLDSIGRSFKIVENQKLKYSGLNNTSFIGGDLEISNNPELENITGFQNCKFIGGKILINKNEILKWINGFSSLQTIKGNLYISDNINLNDIKGFRSLKEVHNDVKISNNPKLKKIFDFNELKKITWNFYLSQNPSLDSVIGFKFLTHIGGEFNINLNPSLTSLNGFSNLKSVGIFKMTENDNLFSLRDFRNLNGILFSLILDKNKKLVSLQGLQNLNYVANRIIIQNNPSLESIEQLSQVSQLHQDLIIENNDKLNSLNGLNFLKMIGGNIKINKNDNLTNIDALYGLKAVCKSMQLMENKILNACCVINHLYYNNIILGQTEVGMNGSQCNSLAIIQSQAYCKDLAYKLNDELLSCGVRNFTVKLEAIQKISNAKGLQFQLPYNSSIIAFEGISFHSSIIDTSKVLWESSLSESSILFKLKIKDSLNYSLSGLGFILGLKFNIISSLPCPNKINLDIVDFKEIGVSTSKNKLVKGANICILQGMQSLPVCELKLNPQKLLFNSKDTFSLNVNASVTEGQIIRVEFYRNNELLGSDASFPYSIIESANNFGSQSYFAVAVDDQGNRGLSKIEVVYINKGPDSKILNPKDSIIYYRGIDINIETNVIDSDTGEVAFVSLLKDGLEMKRDSIAPYTFTFNNFFDFGFNTYSINATDNFGAKGNTAFVNLKTICFREDFDDDATINVNDLLFLLSIFNTNCPGCRADLNDNDIINVEELLRLLSKYGISCK